LLAYEHPAGCSEGQSHSGKTNGQTENLNLIGIEERDKQQSGRQAS
jgi:hypothetical protein